jgi:hypothetical protein
MTHLLIARNVKLIFMSYLEYNNFDNMAITCSECGWKGLGIELKVEDISESSFIIDFCCPKCFEHIGFKQPPLVDDK